MSYILRWTGYIASIELTRDQKNLISLLLYPSFTSTIDKMLLISEEAMRVFVLLFNARTENEGIHTLKMGDRNIVLMFESEDDATSYALLLEAQDFPTPAVESIEQEEVEEFCQSAGYEGQFVPKGFVPQSEADRLLMTPPEANVEQTDWHPEESQTKPMADAELERIRRQLEGLL